MNNNEMNEQSVENMERVVEPEFAPDRDFQDAFKQAYERRLAEIQAVPDRDLVTINLDIHSTVTTILGALPEIRDLREDMRRLPQVDQQLVDGLEDYANAAAEADLRYATAIAPREDIVALHEAAVRQRELLRIDCLALASRNLIDAGLLSSLKGLNGYKNVAFELATYANLLLDAWPVIAGKTASTLEELQWAKALAIRLVNAAGKREQAPVVAAEAAKIRAQAFSLLVRAYDEVRRAVNFLRWREDDADSIAPSLYAGRGGRKPAKPADAAPANAAPANAGPIPGEGANQD